MMKALNNDSMQWLQELLEACGLFETLKKS